jgi:anti-sigma B factor antagonist
MSPLRFEAAAYFPHVFLNSQDLCPGNSPEGTMILPADRIATVPSGNFSVSIRQTGSISLLDLSGRLTSFEASALRDAITRLLKQGRMHMVLNLSRLQYLDSSGIGELARNYVSVVKKGGQMKVVGLSPKVEEVLKTTQLYQVFPEFPSEEEALGSFPESDG